MIGDMVVVLTIFLHWDEPTKSVYPVKDTDAAKYMIWECEQEHPSCTGQVFIEREGDIMAPLNVGKLRIEKR